jgi:hypothetical protein
MNRNVPALDAAGNARFIVRAGEILELGGVGELGE